MRTRTFTEQFLIAAIGASVALLIDIARLDHGSLLQQITHWMNNVMFGFSHISFKITTFSLILTAAASILYFRPLSWKGAFASGFMVIAVMALFVR